MSTAKTNADIERLLWRMSSWQVDQDDVDVIMEAVGEVIAAAIEERAGVPTDAVVMAEAVGGVATSDADALDMAGLDTEPDTEPEAGAEAAESPAETLTEAPTGEDPRACATGAETGVQRVRVSGELTLRLVMPEADVCPAEAAPERVAEPLPEPVAFTPRKSPGQPHPDDDDGRQMRRCRKCRKVHPYTEYIHDTKGRKGRRTVCRLCENERRRMAHAAKKAAERAVKAA